MAYANKKGKLVTNVIKRRYTLLVTFSDGHQEEMTVEAESLSAAGLLLPMTAVTWEAIGDNQF